MRRTNEDGHVTRSLEQATRHQLITEFSQEPIKPAQRINKVDNIEVAKIINERTEKRPPAKTLREAEDSSHVDIFSTTLPITEVPPAGREPHLEHSELTEISKPEPFVSPDIETIAEAYELPEPAVNDAEEQVLPPSHLEVNKELNLVETVTAQIADNMEVSGDVLEQTEALIVALPEIVQERLVEFMEIEDPEAVEPVQELIVEMAVVADRLHELFETGELDGEEAEQIVRLLVEQYTELLIYLEIEIDEKMIAAFIELICSEDYVTSEEQNDYSFKDIFREYRGRLDISPALSYLADARGIEIARLMVRRSTVAV